MSLTENDEQDEFADFAAFNDFASADQPSSESTGDPSIDFPPTDGSNSHVKQSSLTHSNSTDDVEDEDDDDWADDWTSAEPIVTQNATDLCIKSDSSLDNQCTTIVQTADKLSIHNLDILFKEAFETNTIGINHNHSIVKNTPLNTLFNDPSSELLWRNMQSLDESPSLKFKWNQTHSFQQFLSALEIKPVNFNTNVPIFASSLGLLQPVKLSIKIAPEPQQVQSSQADAANQCHTSSRSSITDSPPASNHQKPNCTIQSNSNDAKYQVIQEPLNKKDNSSDTILLNEKQLDPEAARVLDELPILSFMRSNVLMFPVKDDF